MAIASQPKSGFLTKYRLLLNLRGMVHLVVEFKKNRDPNHKLTFGQYRPCINLLQVLGILCSPSALVTSLHHACYCTHTHTLAHMVLKKYLPLCMWWIMKVPLFQGSIWIRSAKLTSKPKKIRTVGFISWLKRAEKSPNFRGVVFPSACHAAKCNEVSWVSRILSGQIRTRSQHHQPWNCYSTYHGLRSIG